MILVESRGAVVGGGSWRLGFARGSEEGGLDGGGGRGGRGLARVVEEGEEGGFVADGEVELLGFGEFGSGVGAGDDVIGVLADGVGHGAAGGADEAGGFLAWEVGEGAGEDEGFAGERQGVGGGRGALRGGLDAELLEAGEDGTALVGSEEVEDGGGGDGADLGEGGEGAAEGELGFEAFDVAGELVVALLTIGGFDGGFGRGFAGAGVDEGAFGLFLGEVTDGVEDGGAGEFGEVGVDLGELPGGLFADLGDGEGVDPAVEGKGAGALEGVEEFGGVLLAEDAGFVGGTEVEGGELGFGEVVEIEGIADESGLDEFFGDDAAEGFEVEGFALGEVFEAAGLLGGAAGDILAAPRDFLGIAAGDGFFGDGTAAGGAFSVEVGDEVEGGGVRGAFGEDDLEDFGDDHAGFTDDDGIADADIFAADFVFVMEGSTGDGGALDEHGVEFGDGGEDAGAADLDGDGAEGGFGGSDPRDRFMDDGIARGTGLGWDAGPVGDAIDFEDDAIDVVGDLAAEVAGVVVVGDDVVAVDLEDVIEVAAEPPRALGGEAEAGEGFEHGGVGVEGEAFAGADGVEDGAEGAGGDDAGVELFQGAGGGIAGVGEGFLAGGGEFGIEGFEVVGGHVGFAAHFEERGWVFEVEFEGDRADGAKVGGDLVAKAPVAAGDAEGEFAVAVVEADGDAVDLRFHDILDFASAE